MAVAAVVALGFGHPAFWLFGLFGETLFLWMMTASKRFRTLVDALDFKTINDEKVRKTEELTRSLSGENTERYTRLKSQFDEAKTYYETFSGNDLIADENLESLTTLEFVFLRLLVAKQHLTSPNRKAELQKVHDRIAALEEEIADPKTSSRAAVESRRATVELLQQRLKIFDERGRAIDEIESDLEQIEAQFQLATESAAIHAKPADAKLDMDLARIMTASPGYLILGEDSSPHLVGEQELEYE